MLPRYGLIRAKGFFDLWNSTDAYNVSPSAFPVESPSIFPTLTLSSSASPTECSGVTLVVTIVTDSYYTYEYGISWQVIKGGLTILSGDGYENNEEYSVQACVEACDADTAFDSFTFTIFDSYGYGLSSSGSYLVTMDGVVKAEGGGCNFGSEETKQFSDCELTRFSSRLSNNDTWNLIGIIVGASIVGCVCLSFATFSIMRYCKNIWILNLMNKIRLRRSFNRMT